MKKAHLVLIIIALTFVTGLATGFSHFFRLVNVLALALVGSYIWAWMGTRWLQATVDRRNSRAQVGDLVEESIRIGNTGPVPKTVLEVRETGDMPGQIGGRVIGLPSRAFRSWKETILCRKRGTYSIGPLVVASRDPFGLFQVERRFGDVATLVVYPRTVDLPNFHIPATRRLGEGNRRQSTLFPAPQISRVRDYAHGDSLSRIHWLTTAKLGRLMSKEYDTGQSSDLWIFIDFEEAVQAGEAEESADEYAVTIAASIARKYLVEQLTVGLIAYGDQRYFLEHETGSGQMDRILEFLAKSKAEGKVPLDQALAQEESLFGRYSSLIIITSSHREDWVLGLSQLLREGIRIEVLLLDASSFGSRYSNSNVLVELLAQGIPTYSIKRGDDLSQALGHRYLSPEIAPVVNLREASL